jgi:tight adherence protein C
MSEAAASALPSLIAAAAGICIALLFGAVLGFRSAVQAPDRTYMDPLPRALRLLWPLVLFVSHYFARFYRVEYLERVQHQLVRAGLNYRIGAEQFVALRVVGAVLLTFLAWALLSLLDQAAPAWLLAAAAFGYAMPQMKLREARQRRERAIAKMLPTYLDFITMAVEAGLSLPGALVQATANGPRGLLRDEFERVNRDIKAGAGRVEALEAMSTRLEMREVTSVVSAVAQAERSGGSIGSTLRVQAEQQRIDRFLRAEKLAMEAPVKLIFPLVAFIFPTTFIVLGFPIAMKILHQV